MQFELIRYLVSTVVIAALILFVSLATMKIPSESSGLSPLAQQGPSSTFVWGDASSAQSPTAVAANPLPTSEPSAAIPSQSSLSHSDTNSHSSSLSAEISSLSSAVTETDSGSASQTIDSPSASSQTRNVPTFTSSPQPLVAPTPTQTTSIVWWQPETTQAVQQAAQVVGQPSILPAFV